MSPDFVKGDSDIASILIDILYIIVLLIGSPYFLYRFIRRKRFPHHISEKMARKALPCSPSDVLVHAVSVGEIEASAPFVNKLRSLGLKVHVTVGTKAGHEVAVKRFGAESVFFFPYDFSGSVKRFLNAHSPKVVALFELEVWPNLVRLCAKNDIPVVVVNGRMTEKSLRGYRRVRWFMNSTWKRIAEFGVQDDEQKVRFEAAGAPPERITVLGSIKFDKQPPAGWENARDELNLTPSDFLVIAGSTHEGEERMVLESWLQLRETRGNLRLLIAPRHMERKGRVLELLSDCGFSVSCRSERRKTDIILLDTVGELARLYGAADIVIMGGTLLPGIGGHNPIEPAVLGKATISGPHFENFRDVTEKLVRDGGLHLMTDAQELLQILEKLASDDQLRSSIGDKASKSVSRNRGANEKYVQLVLKRVQSTKG